MPPRPTHSTAPRPEVLAFLEEIKQRPEDDTPRLVLADWLEEHGDPRGEFVRVQCRLARLAEDDPRRPALLRQQAELLGSHTSEWLGRLPPGTKTEFRRGLLWLMLGYRSLRGRLLRQWVSTGNAVWLGGLQLHHMLGFDSLLALLPRVRLVALGFRLCGLQDDQIKRLIESSAMANLYELDFQFNNLTAGALKALAATPFLARLGELDLGHNGVGPEGAQVLASVPWAAITSLDLSGNRIGDPGAAAVAASPALARLTRLGLGYNRIGPEGAAAIASSPYLANLAVLKLQGNTIGLAGAQALAASPHLGKLTSLWVGDPHARLSEEELATLRTRFGKRLTAW
jgi:uncharacterized protein (TIGR02996 family)